MELDNRMARIHKDMIYLGEHTLDNFDVLNLA
jgi:hypothetical protein